MKYNVRKEELKEYQDENTLPVFTVWASDGNLRSKIATIHDLDICEEHGSAKQFAEKIAIMLSCVDMVKEES